MEPLELDLVVNQGALFALDITVTENGEETDLTGWSGALHVKESKISETTLVEWNDSYFSFSGSTVSIRVPATETKDYTFTSGVYDCKITPPAGGGGAANARRILQGKLTVDKQVTA